MTVSLRQLPAEVVALGAVAAAGLLVVAGLVLGADLPIAWLLLAACAAITVPAVAWGLITGRFFEPLPFVDHRRPPAVARAVALPLVASALTVDARTPRISAASSDE